MRATLSRSEELLITLIEHTVFSTDYDEVLQTHVTSMCFRSNMLENLSVLQKSRPNKIMKHGKISANLDLFLFWAIQKLIEWVNL